MSRASLRTRIVAGLLAVLAGVCLVIGGLSVFLLDRYLTGQLQTQLDDAARRAVSFAGDTGRGRGRGGLDDNDGRANPVDAPGQAAGTLGLIVESGTVVKADLLDREGNRTTVPDAARTQLAALPTDGTARELDLPGLGSYLVVATRSGASVIVTGLPTADVERTTTRLALDIAAVSGLGLLLAFGAGTVVVRLSLRPLDRVAATAAQVAELPLDRDDVSLAVRVPEQDTDPRTEVGQVGAALNQMLDHLSSALEARRAGERRMRRFVADASHELRTPLASVRGYAELTRRHSAEQPGSVPDEIVHALGRVESEAVRMTGLVEDLLLLARLDESAAAAALREDDVDLTAVAVDCVSDAHLLGPDHRWQLDLPEDPVTVTGDPARLRQVLTNLLGNARVHTPPGTTVRVRLRGGPQGDQAGEAVLEVEDDGPGIPADLVPEVFERFTRADSSRSRAAGSTGLGLSIVAGVVEAHGGRVSIASAPGRTVVTVRLPAHRSQPSALVGA